VITNPTRQRGMRAPRPALPAGRLADHPDHQARLSWRLTPRDRWIMRMVHEHRVLTADHITEMAFPSYRSGRLRLRELYLWNVLDRFQPFATVGTAPMHYVLGPAGATALAAEEGLDRAHLGYRHDRALGIAHSLKLAHTVGVNTWFSALTAAARQDGTSHVDAWWSEHRCGRHFGDLVQPDAYGRYTERDRTVEFFLEFDFGTEALARLAGKLSRYADLAAATAISTPLLVWLPTGRRETAARKLLAKAHAALPNPDAVPVATSAADHLDPDDPHRGPADPVWLALTPARHANDGRVRLVELLDGWPHLPPPAQAEPEGDPGDAVTTGATGRPALLPPVPPMPPGSRPAL
jgi:hypothetical protein